MFNALLVHTLNFQFPKQASVDCFQVLDVLLHKRCHRFEQSQFFRWPPNSPSQRQCPFKSINIHPFMSHMENMQRRPYGPWLNHVKSVMFQTLETSFLHGIFQPCWMTPSQVSIPPFWSRQSRWNRPTAASTGEFVHGRKLPIHRGGAKVLVFCEAEMFWDVNWPVRKYPWSKIYVVIQKLKYYIFLLNIPYVVISDHHGQKKWPTQP